MNISQNEAAKEVADKMKKKDLAVLKDMDLTQYAIKGSEEAWSKALKGTPKQGLISVKR